MNTVYMNSEPELHQLPEELLLQVLSHLRDSGCAIDSSGEDPWYMQKMPFRHHYRDDMPHPGLRAYPFLGQVCKKWKALLSTKHAQKILWENLVVDFGHELVTAIHTPLAWSNQRPSVEEFATALSGTSLSVDKILRFIMGKKDIIKTVAFCNSEGFWGDEGEYLSLNNKHNFHASHLGCVFGLLSGRLEEVRLFNCNDLINTDQGLWTLACICPRLRVLAVEGVNCRVPQASAAQLSQLTQLEQLSIIGEEHSGQWIVGLDVLPPVWTCLTSLHTLELRGHQLLDSIPIWMADLQGLRKLDVSHNANINVQNVTLLTRLETLAMQRMDFTQTPVGDEEVSLLAKRVMPDLTPLAPNLTALSISSNRFTRVPACLCKLTKLEVLDISSNKELVIPTPLTPLVTALPHITVMDFRGVHKEKGTYWSESKCTTMKHLAAIAKLLKRRRYKVCVLMDRD